MGWSFGGLAASLVALTIVACSNEVVLSDGVGGSGAGGVGGSGAGGEGGGEPAPAPRSIELAVRTQAGANLDRLGVLVNAADGRLLEHFAGGSLPPSVTARDGDLVSFVHATNAYDAEGRVDTIASYRVAPGVDRIEHAAHLYVADDEYCELVSMQVRVAIPAVPGAGSYFVQTSSGHAKGGSTLPAEVVVEERRCVGDDADFALFVGARGAKFEEVALVEGLSFEPGTTLDVSPTLAPPPRTELRLDWAGLTSATEVFGYAAWQGDPYTIGMGLFFLPPEPDMLELTESPGAAEVVATPMQLALGAPTLFAHAKLPPPAGACAREARFFRRGASAAPFEVDATALAEPRLVGELGYELVGAGGPGDVVRRVFRAGQVEWEVVEDLAQAPLALSPLELPAETPLDFVRPDEPFAPFYFTHLEVDELDGYADFARDVSSTLPRTERAWTVWYRCPDEA